MKATVIKGFTVESGAAATGDIDISGRNITAYDVRRDLDERRICRNLISIPANLVISAGIRSLTVSDRFRQDGPTGA